MTKYTWSGTANGAWTLASNWTSLGGTYPNSYNDEAYIPVSGTTVSLSGANVTVGILQIAKGAEVALRSGATLSVYPPGFNTDNGQTTNLAGTVFVDGTSTLIFDYGWTTAQLGTITLSTGSTLFFSGALDNTGNTLNLGSGALVKGTINGGTIAGDINIAANGTLTLINSPYLLAASGFGAADIDDSLSGGVLRLQDTQTLDDASINLGSAAGDTINQYSSDNAGHVATFTDDVINVTGNAFFTGTSNAGDAVDIDGSTTINVNGVAGYLTISNPTFINQGTIYVQDGDTLAFTNNSALDNTIGSINVDGTSTVLLQGLTTAQIQNIFADSGATIDFGGTGLNNANSVFAPATGVRYEGTITGGAIDGALFVYNGVTLGLAGSPIITGQYGTGAGIVDVSGSSATLALDSTQTLDNLTIKLGSDTLSQANAGTTTTFGPNAVINIVGSASIQGPTTAAIINQGLIDDNVNGANPTFNGITFTNQGQMNFTNHEGLTVNSSVTFTNASGGTIDIAAGANGGSYAFFSGAIANAGTIVVDGTQNAQQTYVYYGGAVTGSGVTQITGGALADFNNALASTQRVQFTGAGELQLNASVNAGVVSGFGVGDSIDLLALHWTGTGTYSVSGNVLSVTQGSVTEKVNLDSTYHGQALTLSDDHSGLGGGDGTLVSITCFYAGTRIATPHGEAAIETLRAGDEVVTADGVRKPVRWIGRQTVSTIFAPRERVLPVRIKAGALGHDAPRRDLLVSPDHAVFVDGVLIDASALVNGVSIVRESRVPDVFTYYHLELDEHALIFAEGALAETFVDNVERLRFDNWNEFEALYPDGKSVAEMPYPRAKSHRQVPTFVRALLASRAAEARPLADVV